MPELPEVHTITTDLRKNILGYTIKKIAIANNYNTLPDNNIFIDKVTDKKILEVNRVAKNILITLEDTNTIHIHLAMTGQLLLREKDIDKRWLKVLFQIEDTQDRKYLAFKDMRMFGKIGILDKKQLNDLYNKYGPEPLDNILTTEEFLKRIQSKRTNIKNVLLDQKIISGLGNIYATDALYMAGVHPETKTSDITLEQAEKLLKSSRSILEESISHRGSTLSDKMYVDIFGKEGSHQNHFKIYGKDKCDKCGNITAFKRINQRGTYFCPQCQK